jgi:23S rRNA (uridine2552-2'-O)-methyltransferase
MSKKWISDRKHDGYYKKAKKEGYRARSSYKLDQINTRYNLIKAGDTVLDLGAAPGGWSQVALEIVGPQGKVVGVDIQGIKPIDNVIFIKGDLTKPETLQKILETVTSVDVVVSDMSPNITGNYSMDHARSIALAETAFDVARKLMRKSGNFVVKVFQGDLFPDFQKQVEATFGFTKAHAPKASRKQSSEIYLIGKGFLR